MAIRDSGRLSSARAWHGECLLRRLFMTDREAKTRAVKILAKSIYRDLEAQGFDEKQIVALATELISEVTMKISRSHDKTPDQQVA
jgi:hypothetical protein